YQPQRHKGHNEHIPRYSLCLWVFVVLLSVMLFPNCSTKFQNIKRATIWPWREAGVEGADVVFGNRNLQLRRPRQEWPWPDRMLSSCRSHLSMSGLLWRLSSQKIESCWAAASD